MEYIKYKKYPRNDNDNDKNRNMYCSEFLLN